MSKPKCQILALGFWISFELWILTFGIILSGFLIEVDIMIRSSIAQTSTGNPKRKELN
jgi:hypothetical protein